MSNSRHSDPAERRAFLRLLYRNWRPTRFGRWVNRFMCWWSGLGLPPRFQAALEVHGRASGRRRSNPVVIATVEGKRYLVSMLGPRSDWVKNVEAAQGDAVIRQGRQRRVHLVHEYHVAVLTQLLGNLVRAITFLTPSEYAKLARDPKRADLLLLGDLARARLMARALHWYHTPHLRKTFFSVDVWTRRRSP